MGKHMESRRGGDVQGGGGRSLVQSLLHSAYLEQRFPDCNERKYKTSAKQGKNKTQQPIRVIVNVKAHSLYLPAPEFPVPRLVVAPNVINRTKAEVSSRDHLDSLLPGNKFDNHCGV
jgi:hypothetical protein